MIIKSNLTCFHFLHCSLIYIGFLRRSAASSLSVEITFPCMKLLWEQIIVLWINDLIWFDQTTFSFVSPTLVCRKIFYEIKFTKNGCFQGSIIRVSYLASMCSSRWQTRTWCALGTWRFRASHKLHIKRRAI